MDKLLAVWDFHDCPRTGIAEYDGSPHYFACGWDASADDYSNVFSLTPINETTLALALEQWSIWCAWERDFHAGRVTAETHPNLGGINSRYDELSRLLKAALATLPPAKIQAVAAFSPGPEASASPSAVRPTMVVWSNAT